MRLPSSSLLAYVLLLTLGGIARAEPSSLDVVRVTAGFAYVAAHGRDGNSIDSSPQHLHAAGVALSLRAGLPAGGTAQLHAQVTAVVGAGDATTDFFGEEHELSRVGGANVGLGATVRVAPLDAWISATAWIGTLGISEGRGHSTPWIGYELQVGQDVAHTAAYDLGWAASLSQGIYPDEQGWLEAKQVSLSLVVGVR